jgi:hypothetical protein
VLNVFSVFISWLHSTLSTKSKQPSIIAAPHLGAVSLHYSQLNWHPSDFVSTASSSAITGAGVFLSNKKGVQAF